MSRSLCGLLVRRVGHSSIVRVFSRTAGVQSSSLVAMQVADTQWRKMQYLYTDDEGVHVMDAENFEQFCVPKQSAAGVMNWLQDGLEVSALMHDDSPVMVVMPPSQITVQVLPRSRLSITCVLS